MININTLKKLLIFLIRKKKKNNSKENDFIINCLHLDFYHFDFIEKS